MPPQDFTTFMLSLPSECKDFSQKGVILFTIPVSPHACPRCHELTSRVHDYRCQPIKTCLTLHTRKQIIYQKRRYRCPECKKVFSENHPFIARYSRIPYSDIAEIIQDHAQLISTCAIAERHDISPTTAARLFHMVSPSSKALDEAIFQTSAKVSAGDGKTGYTGVPNTSANNGALEEGTDLRDFHWAEQWIHGRMQYDDQDIEEGMLWI